MDNDDILYRHLLILIKLFKNRPNHLTKYLLDNDALNSRFIKLISDSKKLSEIYKKNEGNIEGNISINTYLMDIAQMNDYFSEMTEIISKDRDRKSISEITEELNNKLDILLSQEKYEDAIELRDYMIINNIQRNKKN